MHASPRSLREHRLGRNVAQADQIAVLVDGRLAEKGSHDELLQLQGVLAPAFAYQHDFRRLAVLF